MSRIGLKPIVVPAGVEVKINLPLIPVKGPKGTLSKEFPGGIQFEVKDKEITLKRPDDKRNNRMLHGTYRAILANMVKGVSEGFERTLDLVGVGYRVQAKGKDIAFQLGFSHPVEIKAPEGISFKVNSETQLVVLGCDKAMVGQVAANIRTIREPEPYKGKGVRYMGKKITLKQGKKAATK